MANDKSFLLFASGNNYSGYSEAEDLRYRKRKNAKAARPTGISHDTRELNRKTDHNY